MHAVRWMSPVGPCIIIIFYLVFQLKIDQLGSGRAWAETNIAEDTVVFAEGDRNHIRHTSERVNTSSVEAREQPHLGIIQAWDPSAMRSVMPRLFHCRVAIGPKFH